MSSQAPFSQGNATTWKEAICSKTIRLTLFSSRLDVKEGHIFVSLQRQGATLSKFRAASQEHLNPATKPEGCDGRDQAARGGGTTGISMFMSMGWGQDRCWGFSWGAGSSCSLQQGLSHCLPGTCESSSSWCTGLIPAHTGHRALWKSHSAWARMEDERETYFWP